RMLPGLRLQPSQGLCHARTSCRARNARCLRGSPAQFRAGQPLSREGRVVTATFVHLRVHTEYSLVDSVVRVKPLVESVASAGMPAVALTDHGNLFAMVKFYRTAMSQGVQPLIGCDLQLEGGEANGEPSTI